MDPGLVLTLDFFVVKVEAVQARLLTAYVVVVVVGLIVVVVVVVDVGCVVVIFVGIVVVIVVVAAVGVLACSSSLQVFSGMGGGSLFVPSSRTTFCKASSCCITSSSLSLSSWLWLGGMSFSKLAGLPLKSKVLKRGFLSQALSKALFQDKIWSRPMKG